MNLKNRGIISSLGVGVNCFFLIFEAEMGCWWREVIPKPLKFTLSVLKTRFCIGFGIGSGKIESEDGQIFNTVKMAEES